MKIVSWNCAGAFRRKCHALEKLNADIYVIQECEDPARSTKTFHSWAGQFLWVGKTKNKGLAVFSRTGLELQPLKWEDDNLELFLPCRIGDRLNLVGVWTKYAESPNFRYIGQLWKYIQLHRTNISSNPTVLCGDLNSNSQWDERDRCWNHSDVVRELAEIGLLSIYHNQTGEKQGDESTPTLFMYRKVDRPYHIDYAFAPGSILDACRTNFWIGDPNDWLEYSDHMPIAFEILLR